MCDPLDYREKVQWSDTKSIFIYVIFMWQKEALLSKKDTSNFAYFLICLAQESTNKGSCMQGQGVVIEN